MLLKAHKWPLAALLLFCLSQMTACIPYMGLTEEAGKPQTVEISPVELPPQTAERSGSPPLYCKAGRGTGLFQNDWHDLSDTLFALHPGERVNIKISRLHGTEEMTIQALFDRDGQKLIFCPMIDAPPDQRVACASLYALDDDLQEGIKRTFDIPHALRDGVIICAYQQKKLRKLLRGHSGGN